MASAASPAGLSVHRGPGSGKHATGPELRDPASPEDVDKLQHLLQVIVRMFYDDAAIMTLDQVMRFRVVPVDHLAGRLGVTMKDLKVVAKRLLDDQLISEDSRLESPPGAPNPATVPEGGPVPARMRPTRRFYYLFDPHFAFLAIKWRIGEMYKSIEAVTASVDALTTRGYICPQCGATFTSFDAARLFDPNTNDFRCETPGCFTELRADEDRASAKRKEDKMKRFNEQFRYLLSILPQLDAVQLPSANLEDWLHDNGPTREWKAYDLNDKEIQALRRGELVSAPTAADEGPSVAIERDEDGIAIASGTNNSIGTGLQVDVSAVLDPEAAAEKARSEAELKAKTAESNALPAWHLTSTVSGEKTTLGMKAAKRQASMGYIPGADGEAEPNGAANGVKDKDTYDFYASMLQQEGEEDDQFEEVGASTPAPDPAASTGIKRPLEDSHGEPDGAKRARTEEPVQSSSTPASVPDASAVGGGDDDEEEEFEEV